MSDYLVPLIKKYEGLHKVIRDMVYPYLCPAGFPTQGYGILVPSLSSPAITVPEAEKRLLNKLPYYFGQTITLCPRLMFESPMRQAAIVDFTFNLGSGRLKSSTLRRRINSGDWNGACVELRKWVNGGGRKLPGLVLRREAEILLIREGE